MLVRDIHLNVAALPNGSTYYKTNVFRVAGWQVTATTFQRNTKLCPNVGASNIIDIHILP